MEATQTRKPGWKSMPTSFKIFFVLYILTMFSVLFSPIKAFSSGFSFLGIFLSGIFASILVGIISIGAILRLVSIWKRSSWMYKYLLAFGSFLIVNGLLSIIHIRRIIVTTLPEALQDPFLIQTSFITAVVGIILSVLFEGLFLFFVYKNRAVFKKTLV